MKQIKLSLSLNLLLLTGIGMAVTNAVVGLFWAGDVLQREAGHLRQKLSLAVQVAASSPAFLPSPLSDFLAQEPGACLFWCSTYYAGERSDDLCRQGLAAAVNNAVSIGTLTTAAMPSLSEPAAFRYLRVVNQFSTEAGVSTAAAAVPFTSVLRSLWERERIIAVYLLFNALILTALAFFRLLKRYVLPVDRMVQAAETYSGEGFQAALFDRSTNELGQLAISIQLMVRRIEADKDNLNATVRELAEKNDLLQKNQQEMIRTEKLAAAGRMAAGLAHEIGNPLGVVQGYVQMMGMVDCREEERIDYAGKALDELQRMDRLIRRLLDHTHAYAGKAAPCNIGQLLVFVVQSLEIQALCAGIRFTVCCEPAEQVVWLEEDTLRQVLVNALLNAVDAVRSRHGNSGGCIYLNATMQAKGSAAQCGQRLLEICIRDNGIGIPPELFDTVFEPFFTTKEPGKGTGLGLSVSLALIKSMGGRMSLHSEPDQGTTLCIFLPLAEDDTAEHLEIMAMNEIADTQQGAAACTKAC
ncbi:MAG: HAMP domain-containing sensor histidine kinase [Desulfobulbus sp.]|nr:HAMP domain-containing sensor histidine kinase [Desulfobulbus sp.]